MRSGVRRDQILNLVRERERVTVEELTTEMAASAETIRRDLTRLASQGLVTKIHGGASVPNLLSIGAYGEGSFQSRMRLNVREKRAIARRAAELFAPGDTLFIDTGTTTVAFAEELAKVYPLTVVTNSSVIAQQIARVNAENQILLVGGEYRADAAENVGMLAISQINQFRCTHAVLTAGAIDVAGVTDYNLQEAEIALAMVKNAQCVTVLADSAKIGLTGLFTVCSLDDLDRLVTDRPLTAVMRESLNAFSVEVLVARVPEPDATSVRAAKSLRKPSVRDKNVKRIHAR